MSLTNAYTVAAKRIPDLFKKIQNGQAPSQFSNQLLKDWGFTSSNDRAFIPLLKALGFLTSEGVPTEFYHSYRDHSKSRATMGEALRTAYKDLFLITERPSKSDKSSIQGKFKSYHNVSDNVAKLMATNFFQLLELADLDSEAPEILEQQAQDNPENNEMFSSTPIGPNIRTTSNSQVNLRYNIEIHLPATKDIEVYNSIFKSIREHLIDE